MLRLCRISPDQRRSVDQADEGTLQQNKTRPHADRHRLGAARGVHLLQDRRDVEFGGVIGDVQLAGDLFIGQAIGEQTQHLDLAGRQRLDWLPRRIFPPEPNTILPSNAMIQRWLWFVADCIPPDYVLLGRQADFEGI